MPKKQEPALVAVTYVGPHDAVDVAGVVVAQGESHEFPAELAGSLLEQSDNWSKE